MRTQTTHPTPTPLDPSPEGTSPIIRTGPESVVYHIPTTAAPPSISPSSLSPLKTTIALPPHSTWSSGLHFHTRHTEYLRLLRGCIVVHLNNRVLTLSAAAGGAINFHGSLESSGLIVKVVKGARHNWGRADHMLRRTAVGAKREVVAEDWSDEVVVEEWTDPVDVGKALFFWNLNGIITASSSPNIVLSKRQRAAKRVMQEWWIPFQLFVVFWELDNWPVFLSLRDTTGSFAGLVGDEKREKLEHAGEYAMTFFVLWFASVLARVLGVKAVTEERTPGELWEVYRSSGSGHRKRD